MQTGDNIFESTLLATDEEYFVFSMYFGGFAKLICILHILWNATHFLLV